MVGNIKDGNRKAVEAMDASQTRGEVGVGLANQAQTVIDSILASISRISEINNEIATAANSQSGAMLEITGSIDQVVQLSDHSVDVARQTALASDKLETLAVQLQHLIAQFKT
jgi:methyl-accepting chemotaxis protein